MAYHGMIYIREGSNFNRGPIYHDGSAIYLGGSMEWAFKTESGATSTNGLLIDNDGTLTNGIYIDDDGTMTTGLKIDGIVPTAIGITSTTGGKMTMTSTAVTASDPGRHLYLQRTYTGTLGAGKGLTGVEVRSTFNGAAAAATGEVKGGEFKARHTNANAYDVGTMKGLVGNVDSKTGAKTITSAWALEGQIDCGVSSTITTGAGLRVAYNEDGTVTNAYGVYVDGTSVWDVGVKITDSKTTTGIDIGTSTTGLAITGTCTDAIDISGAVTDGIEIDNASDSAIRIAGTPSYGINMGAATTGISMAGEMTTGISFTHTGTTTGISFPNGFTGKAIKVGTLASDSAGSGAKLDATVTRTLEVNSDDADTARATGTMGRAIFGRTMIYADNACEDWGVDGLSKVSAVAKTGNVSAGVVGRFETTGTCTTAAGAGNTFVAGVMGRIGTGGSVTLGAGAHAACVLAFGNNPNGNAFAGSGHYDGFFATVTDVGTAEVFDYGLEIDSDVSTTGIYVGDTAANGIQVVNSALTAGDNYSGVRVAVTAASANNAYGMAAYFDSTVTGSPAGHMYNTGSWINLDNTFVGSASYIVAPFEGGVYEGGATMTNARIHLIQLQAVLTGNPGELTIMRVNATQTVDAVIAAANAGSVGYTTGTGTSGNQTGYIPIANIVGHGVRYIRVYDSAS